MNYFCIFNRFAIKRGISEIKIQVVECGNQIDGRDFLIVGNSFVVYITGMIESQPAPYDDHIVVEEAPWGKYKKSG
ncbi:MAG: hypothetical protein LBF05_02940 [Tannerella sp.]|nr:hypothetical protein [Tannerella sp.]